MLPATPSGNAVVRIPIRYGTVTGTVTITGPVPPRLRYRYYYRYRPYIVPPPIPISLLKPFLSVPVPTVTDTVTGISHKSRCYHRTSKGNIWSNRANRIAKGSLASVTVLPKLPAFFWMSHKLLTQCPRLRTQHNYAVRQHPNDKLLS
jgi:hypothetical protein